MLEIKKCTSRKRDPSDQPARWIAVGRAMAIQENGTESIDDFAMLNGWTLCRN